MSRRQLNWIEVFWSYQAPYTIVLVQKVFNQVLATKQIMLLKNLNPFRDN